VSTRDLVGHGRFALLTGIGGEPWVDAAEAASARLGIEVAAYAIGPGREVLDIYDDWSRLSEVQESGCVLVRPDGFVAWRAAERAADCDAVLGDVLASCSGARRAAGAPRTRDGSSPRPDATRHRRAWTGAGWVGVDQQSHARSTQRKDPPWLNPRDPQAPAPAGAPA
jgi:hypothetical protein